MIDYELTAQQNFLAHNINANVLIDPEHPLAECKLIWLPIPVARAEENYLPTFIVREHEYHELREMGLDMTGAEYELWGNTLMLGQHEKRRWPKIIRQRSGKLKEYWPYTINMILNQSGLARPITIPQIWGDIPTESKRAIWLGICVSQIIRFEGFYPAPYPYVKDWINMGEVMGMLSELFFTAPSDRNIFAFYSLLVDWLYAHPRGTWLTSGMLHNMIRTAWMRNYNLYGINKNRIICCPIEGNLERFDYTDGRVQVDE